MKDSSKSSFIFDLIDEYEICTPSGKANILTDETYDLFCDKYKLYSEQRDLALYNYVISSPNIFRSHVPHSKWVFSIVYNTIWYYDELIVNDPIIELINNPIDDKEQQKYNLQERLLFLKTLKESINGGYLLFAGSNIMPNRTSQFQNESNRIIETPQVLNAFEAISYMMKKPSPINDNEDDNLTQLEVKYDGFWSSIRTMGMYIPPHVFNATKLAKGISYDFLTPYERLTKEELITFNKLDILNALKKEYCNDISIVLEALTNAQRLNMSVLFYRDADCEVANTFAVAYPNKTKSIIADTAVYNCSLPYMDGIPSERLFDIRNQIPDAFKEFRAFLFELVAKTMKSTDNPIEFKYKMDNEINSMLRKLEVEMKSAKRKWNFQGVLVPLAVLTGSLGLFSSGIDYSKLFSAFLGSGGIAQGLSTWANVKSEIDKATLNPVYFLWKAQQKRE